MDYVYLYGVAFFSILVGFLHRPEKGETADDALKYMIVALLWPLFILGTVGVCIRHYFEKIKGE